MGGGIFRLIHWGVKGQEALAARERFQSAKKWLGIID